MVVVVEEEEVAAAAAVAAHRRRETWKVSETTEILPRCFYCRSVREIVTKMEIAKAISSVSNVILENQAHRDARVLRKMAPTIATTLRMNQAVAAAVVVVQISLPLALWVVLVMMEIQLRCSP